MRPPRPRLQLLVAASSLGGVVRRAGPSSSSRPPPPSEASSAERAPPPHDVRVADEAYTALGVGRPDAPGGAEAEAFLACTCGSELRVVSAADASSIGEPIDGDSEAVTALALSPDSRLLFAAGHSRLIRVWDLASRTCIRSWKIREVHLLPPHCLIPKEKAHWTMELPAVVRSGKPKLRLSTLCTTLNQFTSNHDYHSITVYAYNELSVIFQI